ncbi:lycopene cyclase family protein [Subtercola boreus]|uniref:Lycopene cyclase n=1 Tax=Subtercola boreus TaxID=120213 RepID=A0A3E0W6Z6_9MICO|nr:lycopene cyclase family protein [Subtercola boreus]RFA18019.1 hypothetical protein B7R24_15295 [Subtercola boreus]RFA18401.1 hypothetical protein B7R23_15330 [Subtercola boreus]RFA24930.1 hypothetical protein B7R25_15325 [Subtercola boreus]
MTLSSTTAHLPRGAVVEVPPELLLPAGSTANGAIGLHDYVILGGGCAGLSAAIALLDAGASGSILIVDSRVDYRDDRTWCFWDVEPTPFTHLARGRWNSWEVRSAGSRAVSSPSAGRTAYVSIAANDFYLYALDRLVTAGTVRLLFGEPAEAYVDTEDEVIVTTARHSLRARQVIDARGLGMSGVDRARSKTSGTSLPQAFVGLHIVADHPVFDEDSCLLMDFTVDQSCGLRFMYVVPVSATEALVENVFLTETGLSEAAYVAGIELYLARSFGLEAHQYRVLSRERGCIPMTDSAFDNRPSPRVTLLGTLGGATRPSTGYTFLRIQRSCRAAAARLVNGSERGGESDPCSLLDSIFLRFLRDHPERAPRVFHRMFDAVDPNALVRFLSDQSDWRDIARLIIALPKIWFLAAALKVLVGRLGNVAR